jgi:hypothetical protein
MLSKMNSLLFQALGGLALLAFLTSCGMFGGKSAVNEMAASQVGTAPQRQAPNLPTASPRR